MIGLEKVSSDFHKFLEIQEWKESRAKVWSCLQSKDTHSSSQKLFPSCPDDPATSDALHPTVKHSRMQ